MADRIKLYHGTYEEFLRVDLEHCKDNKDFGLGFYTTTDYQQALRWALKVSNKGRNGSPFVNMYVVEKRELEKYNPYIFKTASHNWLKYVIMNRIFGADAETDICKGRDIVVGKVADDAAQIIIQHYVATYGIKRCLDESDIQDRMILELKPERLTDQYCFKTDRSLELLNKQDENGVYKVSIKRIQVK